MADRDERWVRVKESLMTDYLEDDDDYIIKMNIFSVFTYVFFDWLILMECQTV